MERLQPEYRQGYPLFVAAEEARQERIRKEWGEEDKEKAELAKGDMIQRSPHHGDERARKDRDAKRRADEMEKQISLENERYNSM